VVDSVAALVLKRIEGKWPVAHGFKRLDEPGVPEVTGVISKSKASYFINHCVIDVGVMFGNPETTPGAPRSSSILRGLVYAHRADQAR